MYYLTLDFQTASLMGAWHMFSLKVSSKCRYGFQIPIRFDNSFAKCVKGKGEYLFKRIQARAVTLRAPQLGLIFCLIKHGQQYPPVL